MVGTDEILAEVATPVGVNLFAATEFSDEYDPRVEIPFSQALGRTQPKSLWRGNFIEVSGEDWGCLLFGHGRMRKSEIGGGTVSAIGHTHSEFAHEAITRQRSAWGLEGC